MSVKNVFSLKSSVLFRKLTIVGLDRKRVRFDTAQTSAKIKKNLNLDEFYVEGKKCKQKYSGNILCLSENIGNGVY